MSRQEQAERSCIGHKSGNSLGITRSARDCDIYLYTVVFMHTKYKQNKQKLDSDFFC